ncbi:wd g-beta repeat-containing protein [Cystoisospora suis]|uniref:Wd g-beta repeat-containing protein n=1 Tax=Cystoisospora suis TaxID=483139 RepID=A0A2C6L3T5_9APIC|nr:wd g-beta repeat-containing protein [Cystoisospora suis]
MVGGSTPVVLTNRCRRGRVPSCRSVRHGLSFHQTMLFRVCSTNSTKAVAFLHSDKFLAAGVGSVLRVYDCNVVACCESRQHQWQGCSVAHWEAQAETHPKKDEASLLLADVPPVSRLVDQALFSSSTHISGIATSSQHSLVAAFGLGRLVVYELRQRAAKREKPQGALQEKEDGQLGSAVEICTQSLGAQQRHQADLPQLGKETPHPAHFLSPVFNYKRDQWILDVRIISPSLLNEGSTGDGAAGGSGLVRVLILVGLADGTVELLSASRSSTHCLATWTCGDRSLLYSLAIDVPRDAWVGPRSNGRCYSEVQVLGGSPLPLDECTETDTNKNCSAVFTERRRQSGAFLTIASGTVYSSIVLWRIPLSPQCQTPHLPDSTDRCTSGEKAHACYSSTSTADSPIDSGESNAVDSCGQKHFSPSFSPRSGATVVNPTQILKGHRGVIFKVRFYLDGQLLCSSSDDRELRLWWAGGPMSHELPKEEACKRSESLLKTDNYRTSYKCVSVLRGHRSRVWDIALLDLFMSQKYSVSSSPLRNDEEKTVAAETSSEMAFSVAERRYLIVSAGEDSSCRIWSLRGECLYSLLGHAGRGVRAICATESRTSGSLPLLASGGEDGDVKLWSLIESPSLVKLLKPRFFCSRPNSSSLVSSTTLSGYGPVINREIAPGTLRDADSTKDNKEVIAGRDIALPSVTGHSDFALIWDCRDYGRSDDFIREVRLLSTHCALVATNFGYVYLLHMKEFNSSDKERHTAEYLKQKNPTGETLTEAASLVANRKKHGLALVCTALVHSPVVLTSLRVVDSLVTCGCADGTFFFFLLDREAAQNEGVWQAGSDDRKAKISDPPRWQCFQQARVGNLFQLSLPCSDLEHEYLQRRGAVGGLHAVARNSLATRSFWTEVDVYGLCGSQDQPDSPCGVKSGELPQQPVTPVTSLSEEREYKANDHCSAHGGSHSDMNMNQEAFPSKRCTSFVGQRSVVAATSHTGLVSMWYVAAEQGVGPSGQLDVLDHPESLDKTGRHGDYEGTTALPDVGVTSCHTKARRGDGEAGEPDTPFPQKKSGFFAQVIATLQLPPTAQRKGDSTRCFSCLPLMGVSTGVSPDTKGDCEEDTIAKGGLDWAVQALTIALLFGDEAGSLHVVQVLVPELLDNDKDHKRRHLPGG